MHSTIPQERLHAILFPHLSREKKITGPCVTNTLLHFTSRAHQQKVSITDLAYIQLLNNFVIIRLMDGQLHITHRTRKTNIINPIGNGADWLKVNQSFVVKKEFICNWDDKTVTISYGEMTWTVPRDLNTKAVADFQRKLRTV